MKRLLRSFLKRSGSSCGRPDSMEGFGLLGAMGALLVLGGAIAVSINMMPGQQERESVEFTQKLLPRISDMLTDFAATHSRLPCPDLNDNGYEGDASGNCTAGQQVGTVPWRTLRLADPTLDGMGVAVRYGVFRDSDKADLTVADNYFTPEFPTVDGAAAQYSFEPFASISSDIHTNSTLSTFGTVVDEIKSAIPGGDIILPGNLAESFSLHGLLNKQDGLVDKLDSTSEAINLYDLCVNLDAAAEADSDSALSHLDPTAAAEAYQEAYDAEYARATEESTYSTAVITQMAKEKGEEAAKLVEEQNPAYILVSGNRLDADQNGADGAFDGYNEGTDARFDNPLRGRSGTYDDVMMAMSLDKLQVNLGCSAFITAIDGMTTLTQDWLSESAGAQANDMQATISLVMGYWDVLNAGFDLAGIGTCAASQVTTVGICSPNFPAGTAGAVACGVAAGACIACGAVAVTNLVASTLSQVTAYRNKVASSETVDGSVAMLAEVMNAAWGMDEYGALYPYAVEPITDYGGLVLAEIDQDAVDAAEAEANASLEEMESENDDNLAAEMADVLVKIAESRAEAVENKTFLEDLETTLTDGLTARGIAVEDLTTEVLPLGAVYNNEDPPVLVTAGLSLSAAETTQLAMALDLDEEMRDEALSPSLRDRISYELGDETVIVGDASLASSYTYIDEAPRGPYDGQLAPDPDTEEAENARNALNYIRDEIIDGLMPTVDPDLQADMDAASNSLAEAEAEGASVSTEGLDAETLAEIEANQAMVEEAKAAQEEEKELTRDETRQLQELVAFEDLVEEMNLAELMAEIEEGITSQDSLIFDLDCIVSSIQGPDDPDCPDLL
ncbi:MAG: hypothetical protein HQL52_16310 [Magnetococcales bacterium]|nr:hypothetical protein [Magnetococcales bacterium]